MGSSISKKLRDPFGFGNTEVEKTFAKFAPLPSMNGVRVAVTGGTNGIGLAAAKKMASLGAEVIVLGRDQTKGAQAVQEIGGNSRFMQVDMTDFNSISNLNLPEVDVLVHNAGAMFDVQRFVQWPSGMLDESFALHVAGPYLLSKLAKTKYTIWTSSGGLYTMKLNVNELLNPPTPFDGMKQYARCKRAQVTIAKKVGHQSMHPGWVDTQAVVTAMPSFYEKTKDVLRTPDQGADTLVWLAATRPAEVAFWFDRKAVSEFKMPFTTHSEEEAARLMAEMERVTFIPPK